MKATLSILGLYNYDETIFDDFKVPYTGTKRQTLIDNILMECAELEILYPSAPFMKKAISTWSAMMLPVWTKLLATESLEYNPIENYDRTEEWDDSTNTSGQRTTQSTSNTTTAGTGLAKTAAFDAGSLKEASSNDSSGNSHGDGLTQDQSQGSTHVLHSARIHGNIGVTTSQQMLQQERDVSKFNTMEVIIEDFQRRFCLLVY